MANNTNFEELLRIISTNSDVDLSLSMEKMTKDMTSAIVKALGTNSALEKKQIADLTSALKVFFKERGLDDKALLASITSLTSEIKDSIISGKSITPEMAAKIATLKAAESDKKFAKLLKEDYSDSLSKEATSFKAFMTNYGETQSKKLKTSLYMFLPDLVAGLAQHKLIGGAMGDLLKIWGRIAATNLRQSGHPLLALLTVAFTDIIPKLIGKLVDGALSIILAKSIIKLFPSIGKLLAPVGTFISNIFRGGASGRAMSTVSPLASKVAQSSSPIVAYTSSGTPLRLIQGGAQAATKSTSILSRLTPFLSKLAPALTALSKIGPVLGVLGGALSIGSGWSGLVRDSKNIDGNRTEKRISQTGHILELLGGAAGIAAIALAPFTGGSSLLIGTIASIALTVTGSILGASKSQIVDFFRNFSSNLNAGTGFWAGLRNAFAGIGGNNSGSTAGGTYTPVSKKSKSVKASTGETIYYETSPHKASGKVHSHGGAEGKIDVVSSDMSTQEIVRLAKTVDPNVRGIAEKTHADLSASGKANIKVEAGYDPSEITGDLLLRMQKEKLKISKEGYITNFNRVERGNASKQMADLMRTNAKVQSKYEFIPKELVQMDSFRTDLIAPDRSGVYISKADAKLFYDMRREAAKTGKHILLSSGIATGATITGDIKKVPESTGSTSVKKQTGDGTQKVIEGVKEGSLSQVKKGLEEAAEGIKKGAKKVGEKVKDRVSFVDYTGNMKASQTLTEINSIATYGYIV